MHYRHPELDSGSIFCPQVDSGIRRNDKLMDSDVLGYPADWRLDVFRSILKPVTNREFTHCEF